MLAAPAGIGNLWLIGDRNFLWLDEGGPSRRGLPTQSKPRSVDRNTMKRILFLLLLALLPCGPALAQSESERVNQLERRVSKLEQKIKQVGDRSAILMLFGAFCALWAQNSGRNAWLWFFLGAFFSVITVLVLLWKHSNDLDRRGRMGGPPRPA